MANLLKKIRRGVKASVAVVKESVASPRARAVYKETWHGAKQIGMMGEKVGKRYKKASKAHMMGEEMHIGSYPSVFEPTYVTKVIKKARKRKKKKSK